MIRPTSHDFLVLCDDEDSSNAIPAGLPGASNNAAAAPQIDEGDDDSSAAAVGDIKTVWEGGKIQKYIDEKGRPMMRCLHGCGGSWRQSHTKALGHVRGGCRDIARCKFVSAAWLEVYHNIGKAKKQSSMDRLQAEAKLNRSLDAIEDTARAALTGRSTIGDGEDLSTLESPPFPPSSSQVSCLTESSSFLMPPPAAATASVATGQALASVFQKRSREGAAVPPASKKRKGAFQTNIVTTLGKNLPQAEQDLHLAISHFIHALGLPFNLAEHSLFRRILIAARNVNSRYSPPGRNEVGGKFLTMTHASYQLHALEQFKPGADLFGGSLSGDGATVNRCPLLNILATSPSNHALVLDIIDCSAHMRAGLKKDALSICRWILPLLAIVDPQKTLIDLVTFDGASNVQKAAKFMKLHYPMITISPAIEHTVSLVFEKVMELRPISCLIELASKV